VLGVLAEPLRAALSRIDAKLPGYAGPDVAGMAKSRPHLSGSEMALPTAQRFATQLTHLCPRTGQTHYTGLPTARGRLRAEIRPTLG
jgi:hypothetical protein